MSRCLTTAVFALLSFARAAGAVDTVGTAVADPTLRTVALACYSLLNLAIVIAFTIFVLLRSPTRRPSRDPVAFIACAAAIATVLVQQPPSHTTATSFVVAGDIVAVVASAWMLVSVLALGKCFGVLPEGAGRAEEEVVVAVFPAHSLIVRQLIVVTLPTDPDLPTAELPPKAA